MSSFYFTPHFIFEEAAMHIFLTIGGALVIGVLGGWSNQHRATIMVTCVLWGGLVQGLCR